MSVALAEGSLSAHVRGRVFLHELSAERLEDIVRGEVMVGIAATLWALADDSCPEQGGDQTLIRAWHKILWLTVISAREAITFTGWNAGQALVDEITIQAGDLQFWEDSDDDEELTRLWYQLMNDCHRLYDAAKAQWPEIDYTVDQEMDLEAWRYWQQRPRRGDGNPKEGP